MVTEYYIQRRRERNREYYRKNKEKLKERNREYKKNKKKLKELFDKEFEEMLLEGKERKKFYYHLYGINNDRCGLGNPKKIKELCKIFDISDETANIIAVDGQLLDKKLEEIQEKHLEQSSKKVS